MSTNKDIYFLDLKSDACKLALFAPDFQTEFGVHFLCVRVSGLCLDSTLERRTNLAEEFSNVDIDMI